MQAAVALWPLAQLTPSRAYCCLLLRLPTIKDSQSTFSSRIQRPKSISARVTCSVLPNDVLLNDDATTTEWSKSSLKLRIVDTVLTTVPFTQDAKDPSHAIGARAVQECCHLDAGSFPRNPPDGPGMGPILSQPQYCTVPGGSQRR